jgi:hypothetical protein
MATYFLVKYAHSYIQHIWPHCLVLHSAGVVVRTNWDQPADPKIWSKKELNKLYSNCHVADIVNCFLRSLYWVRKKGQIPNQIKDMWWEMRCRKIDITLFWRVLTMVWCISKNLALWLYPTSSVFTLKTTFLNLALPLSSDGGGGHLLCGVP